MIDKFTIMFSTLMVLYIILRAAKLDRTLPWFETKSLYEQAKNKLDAARQAAFRGRGQTAAAPLAGRSVTVKR
jgi:hypothetical protein